ARYGYDAQGRATLTVDADGRALRIAYAPPARAGGTGTTTVVDADGRRARYRWTYDRHRHVARLLDAEGEACASCAPAPRAYRWATRGRLAAVDVDGVVLRVVRDTLGRPVEVLRTGGDGRGEGRATQQWRAGWHADGLDLAWLEQPSVAPGHTHRIAIERDARGRVVAVSERGFAPEPDVAGGIGWRPIARRFAMGHREPGATPVPADALTGLAWVDGPEPGPVDRIAIDHQPDALTLAFPAGGVETLRYRTGVLVEHRALDGTHASMRHALHDEHWLGGPTVVAAYAGARRIELERDGSGTLQAVILAGPGTRRVLRPRLIEHRHGDGAVTRYRRDPSGRLLEAVRDGPRGRTLLGRFRWEGAQLVEAANDAVTIRYGHDAAGRLVSAEHTFAERPQAPLRWHWHHDLAGRVDAEVLPGGLVARYAYDGAEVARIVVEGLDGGPVSIDPAALRAPLSLRPPVRTGYPPAQPRFEGGRLVEAAGARQLADPHGRRAARRAHDPMRGARDGWYAHHDWRLRAEHRASGVLRQWLWAGALAVAFGREEVYLKRASDR
ncbi:MAG TPA: hypothetical protein PKC20_03330, partial [Burkholderiaceae bacterium]|nr:hypothetical protein [Burkholderiaceae bacterium]